MASAAGVDHLWAVGMFWVAGERALGRSSGWAGGVDERTRRAEAAGRSAGAPMRDA